LAYKITFTTLNGFDGNDKIANCDDVFCKTVGRFPDKVHYLKSNNTIVTTYYEQLEALFYQRVRWAAKQVHIKVILEGFSISRIGGKCLLVTNYWLFLYNFDGAVTLAPYNFENSI
jgi:hypothetical protein